MNSPTSTMNLEDLTGLKKLHRQSWVRPDLHSLHLKGRCQVAMSRMLGCYMRVRGRPSELLTVTNLKVPKRLKTQRLEIWDSRFCMGCFLTDIDKLPYFVAV